MGTNAHYNASLDLFVKFDDKPLQAMGNCAREQPRAKQAGRSTWSRPMLRMKVKPYFQYF